jgi:uncharacterized protein YlaI
MLHDSSMNIRVAIARLLCDKCDQAHSHRMTMAMLADILLHGYVCQACVDRFMRKYFVLH